YRPHGNASNPTLAPSPSYDYAMAAPRGRSPGRRKEKRRRSRDESRERIVWEQYTVVLDRKPAFGFGIAVSGGIDNPHFTSGETSIVISDVLSGGPAEAKLKVNDRVIMVNNRSMENVEHCDAVSALKNSGDTATLVVKRKMLMPIPGTPEPERPPEPQTVTLTKNKKEEYGIKLGIRIYVKEITGIAAKDGTLAEGDVVVKINNSTAENLSLADAKKLLDKSKDKLSMVILKDRKDEERRPPDEDAVVSSNKANELRANAVLYDGVFEKSVDSVPFDQDLNRSRSPERVPGRKRSHMSEDDSAPPRPPPPALEDLQGRSPRPPTPGREDYRYYPSEMHVPPRHKRRLKEGEERYVVFRKTSNLGIRLAGGNEVGIFIADVQESSPAAIEGLFIGDLIMQVNDIDMHNVTREEAVLLLLSLQDEIRMIVQYRKGAFDKVVEHGGGDNIHIRAHFNYDKTTKEELSFKKGDIMRVRDTLYNGVVGSWQAVKLNRNNMEVEKGVIPNKNRAEQLALAQNTGHSNMPKLPQTEGRAGFFKRRSGRRSKSLTREHWDEVVFGGKPPKYPAYERVVLRDPGFFRPIVFFGPISDLAREKLLGDFPERFENPLSEKTESKSNQSMRVPQAVIKLYAIRDVMDKQKHCVLDITPNAVDKLNYAQLYPIAIFLRPDSRHTIREIRGQLGEGKIAPRSSRRLYDLAIKLDEMYSHIFTATVHLAHNNMWYSKVKDIIRQQQSTPIWMAEMKIDDALTEDLMFPMTTRLSYASSPESDLSLHLIGGSGYESAPSPTMDRQNMVRSSSDPNLRGHDGYHMPPAYSYPRKYRESNQQYIPNDYRGARHPPPDDYYQQRPSRRDKRPHQQRTNYDYAYQSLPKAKEKDYDYPRSTLYSPPQPPPQPPEQGPGDYVDKTSRRRIESDHVERQRPLTNYEQDKWYSSFPRSKSLGNQDRPDMQNYKQRYPNRQQSAERDRRHMDRYSSDLYPRQQPMRNQKDYENFPPQRKQQTRERVEPPREYYTQRSEPYLNKYDDNKTQYGTSSRPVQHDKLPDRTNRNEHRAEQKNDPYKYTRSTAMSYKTVPTVDPFVKRSKDPDQYRRNHDIYSKPKPTYTKTVMDDEKMYMRRYRERSPSPPPPPVKTRSESHIYRPVEAPYSQGRDPRTMSASPEVVIPKAVYPTKSYPLLDPAPPPRARDNNPDRYNRNFDDRYRDERERYVPERHHRQHEREYSEVPNEQDYYRQRDYYDYDRQRRDEYGHNDDSGTDHDRRGDTDRHPAYIVPIPRHARESEDERGTSHDEASPEAHSRDPNQPPPLPSSSPPPLDDDDDEPPQINGRDSSLERNLEIPKNLERDRQREHPVYNNPKEWSDSLDSGTGTTGTSAYPYHQESYKAYKEKLRQKYSHTYRARNEMNTTSTTTTTTKTTMIENTPELRSDESDKAPTDDGIVTNGDKDDHDNIFMPVLVSDNSFDADDGHTVVATARGVFDYNGGCLSSVESGVSIIIPKGAIPENIQQEIYFKVCKDNNILPPLDTDKGETLLSPLVMCGPHGLKFLHPVELRLPHCASMTPDGWSFALKSSDTPAGQPAQWQNLTLAGSDESQCHVGTNSVSVLVDHF
uniref:Tight junction protein ZO-1 n=2 Tax=Saccoglossus kowalevskii TaxID=10224 RepID=A0ABM0LZP6_SACKO